MKSNGILSIPIFPAITLLFIILKLNDIVNWSWVWVFCPIWLPLLLIVCLCVTGVVYHSTGKQR